VETSLFGALGFLLLASLALLLDAMVAVLIGMAAFFVEEVRPIYWIYSKLLMSVGGMFLPLDMFPDWLRRLSNWLPFRLVIYAPARTFVAFDSDFLLRALGGQIAYLVAFGAIMAVAWHYGSRRIVVHGG
jgi:ABC-2 type transport system permease protein